jgi:hypothetical protein
MPFTLPLQLTMLHLVLVVYLLQKFLVALNTHIAFLTTIPLAAQFLFLTVIFNKARKCQSTPWHISWFFPSPRIYRAPRS